MIEEDRNIITAIVAAAEQRIANTIAASTAEKINTLAASMAETIAASRAETIEATRAMLDRAIEANAANLSDLRGELIRRLDTIERRTERTEINLSAMMLQTAGMSRSLSQAEALDSSFAAQLSVQQRAIDDLYQRLTRSGEERRQ